MKHLLYVKYNGWKRAETDPGIPRVEAGGPGRGPGGDREHGSQVGEGRDGDPGNGGASYYGDGGRGGW